MNAFFWVNYGILLVMQALAQIAMRVGSSGGASMASRRWWFGFVLANAVGAPSILFLKQLYKAIPATPNIVHALMFAGVFIVTQFVFAVFFRARLRPFQYIGVGLLAIGAFLVSIGASDR